MKPMDDQCDACEGRVAGCPADCPGDCACEAGNCLFTSFLGIRTPWPLSDGDLAVTNEARDVRGLPPLDHCGNEVGG